MIYEKRLERNDKNLWEDYLYMLTPAQKIGDVWFKREDLFRPMGEGGINGSKLRQLIYLISNAQRKGAKGIISGSVTGSPQHIMTAVVSAHYGLPCTLIANTKTPINFKMLTMAKEYGAEIEYYPVGYAKTLEAASFTLAATPRFNGYFPIEMNICLHEKRNQAPAIRDFHAVGAFQVQNIPEHITRLIIPCGSCTSVTSILYGLTMYPHPNLKEIVLMGIGNNGSKNINYIWDRLLICTFPNYMGQMFGPINEPGRGDQIKMTYHNLNGEGFCKYEDLMPANYHGLDFHPRYEGKIMNYIRQKGLESFYFNDESLFWIVGSEPKF